MKLAHPLSNKIDDRTRKDEKQEISDYFVHFSIEIETKSVDAMLNENFEGGIYLFISSIFIDENSFNFIVII